MNEREYEELERRIAERKRIKAMAEDLAASEKETRAYSEFQRKLSVSRGERAWCNDEGGTGRMHDAGGAFMRTQISNGEY